MNDCSPRQSIYGSFAPSSPTAGMQNETARGDVERRISALDASIDRLEQAFVFDRTIDAATYRSQLQRLRDELTAAECELSDARFDELEVEGVLVFAEHVLGNMASLWSGANPADRMRLQTTVFPTGLVWSADGFGTAVTNPAFSWLRAGSAEESGVASPVGRLQQAFESGRRRIRLAAAGIRGGDGCAGS